MIDLLPYDPIWRSRFEEEARALRTAFGALARRIEHVGSTAVPGLVAKPIIDIQVSVESLASFAQFLSLMRGLGYAHLPDADPVFERNYPYFHKPVDWPHSHHVHLCEEGSLVELKHIAFRDRLRADVRSREQYAALKRKLAALHGGSTHEERQGYSDGKSEFVRSLLVVPSFLEEFSRWAAGRRDIIAAALVGSHARGTATQASDVDLVILCDTPEDLLAADWPKMFGEMESRGIEDYGALRSLRVHYRGGLEVEFGVAQPSWAALPLDPGTRAVLAAGACILHDPSGILREARRAALRQPAERMG